MIDFRYHVVSLGAVFIALAVGIILGAGPLQNSIGETLSSEVTALKETNAELRSENDDLQTAAAADQAVLAEALPELLTGTAVGQKVALVSLPDTTSDEIATATETVKTTGAEVIGAVRLTTAWVDQDASSYRTALAEQLRSHLESYKAQNPVTFKFELNSENEILSAALTQILSANQEDQLTQTIRGLLTNAEKPLIEFDTNFSAPANIAVVLSANYSVADSELGTDEQKAQEAAVAEVNTKFAEYISSFAAVIPVVVSGYAEDSADFVAIARENGKLQVTTDSFNETIGQINLGLSLAAAINKTTLHAGDDTGAKDLIASRVVISAPGAAATSEDNSSGQ